MTIWVYLCGGCKRFCEEIRARMDDEYLQIILRELGVPALCYTGDQGIDTLVILRADLPSRYGRGEGAGLQTRLPLCDFCGGERGPT